MDRKDSHVPTFALLSGSIRNTDDLAEEALEAVA
jgi:hypothetical protein